MASDPINAALPPELYDWKDGLPNLFNYAPRKSHEVRIGNCPLGGDHPLRIQSMTTTPTADAAASAAQCRTIIEAGADYVRLTAQGTREAEALREIKEALRREGISTPLVADIHFNPNVADVAAEIVEKVRINPGNYVDPARKFKHIEYTDEAYAEELRRLEERFVKLLGICRAHGTALRIGVNHGSLSDRIMSRYGDTPEGIVESCMEFLRVCVREGFKDAVVSIKASNTVVMVRSVRLLCKAMADEGMDFPLHLGVESALFVECLCTRLVNEIFIEDSDVRKIHHSRIALSREPGVGEVFGVKTQTDGAIICPYKVPVAQHSGFVAFHHLFHRKTQEFPLADVLD